jgi:hypothetical protein
MMLTKIESIGFWVGIFSVLTMLSVILNYQNISPSTFDFFRGGNFEGMLVGMGMFYGFISVILFPINLAIKNRSAWFIRALLMLTFLVCAALLGSYV